VQRNKEEIEREKKGKNAPDVEVAFVVHLEGAGEVTAAGDVVDDPRRRSQIGALARRVVPPPNLSRAIK
jgi:hypothetical protein